VRADESRVIGGALHLVLEALGNALDEAVEGATLTIDVVLHADTSVGCRRQTRHRYAPRCGRGMVVKPAPTRRGAGLQGERYGR